MHSRVGKLLVAHPNLPENDWFRRTVIYIYNDNDQNTLGVALNVETSTSVKKLCYDKGIIYPSEYPSVYKGGPVQQNTVLMLHTSEWISQNTISAGPGYHLSSDSVMFERLSLGDQPAYWKMCLGLCAWAPGQLDAELSGKYPYDSSNSWLICDANDDIIFNHDGEEQWKAAVELSSYQMINQFF